MSATEDPDLALARQLQEQFDRELVELSSGDEDSILLATELQKRFDAETIELSEGDDDDDVIVQGPAIVKVERKVSTADSPPPVKFYRAERRDLNAQEYFIEELQTYVDPENNFEWKFVEVMPDLKAMFLRLDELFFQSRFKAKNFQVLWSQAIGKECTNRNFNDPTDGRYTIVLNETLLALRPRIEIISILLHEMIHAFLKLEGVQEPNNGHGANFRKMMIFINRMLQTNISFSHRLTNTNTLCRTEWYRCTGICHNYKPFQGIVRSTDDAPGLQNEWWRVHAENCGGTFYKIYEMSRIDEDGEVSTRYAVNVRYMKPKREDIRGRYKSRLPPKESIDLTSGTPRVIPTLTETVSLDDDGPRAEDTKAADKFIQNFNRSVALTRDSYEMQCPICQDRIKRKLFGSHIDGCKGVVQRIQLKCRRMIVQNGTEEHRPSLNVQPNYSASTSTVDNRALGSSSTIADYQRIKKRRFL
ncbi:DNA-dependent metalloprotease dvc-1-like [Culex quinquefasciatus]|uniref:DNA-dependent metalloprotease dvc-1-like n=1 Tax=Culex quinquefasciatus TaxID=7176 RepID=UPI0018E3983F|nr:DNA-dependent metalloprotease dvc-1-like [Culex quinquefasciatus]